MNKKRYILVVGIILIGIVSLIILNNKLDNKETVLDEVKLKDETKTNKKSFAIMIQKEDKTGYDVYEENTWPTEGYAFNSELSGCIDNYGSIVENSLSYDKDTNKITINTGVTSSCYVYFDIKNTCSAGQALSECLTEVPPLGLDSNIIDGDTLYRFSGISGNEGINNYICLGTTSKCSNGSDNMYRIIGVEPSTGYVKVIKQIKYDNTTWHSNTSSGTFTNSKAYNIMVTWYNSVAFKNMIVEHTWNIGDIGSDTYIGSRADVLSYEDNTTTTAYVGMLSLSDYYLAYRIDQNWSSSYNNYSNYTNNWIHLANNGNTSDAEWTMLRYDNLYAWAVYYSGYVSSFQMYDMYDEMYDTMQAVRPTFYLNSTVNYISGSGTSEDPFLVS